MGRGENYAPAVFTALSHEIPIGQKHDFFDRTFLEELFVFVYKVRSTFDKINQGHIYNCFGPLNTELDI